jgi:flagellar hook-basal body complex protein FliE
MAIPAATAANAYAALAQLRSPTAGSGGGGGGDGGGGPDFGAVLKDVIAGVTAVSRTSDMQAQAVAAGKANMIDVVTAVAESETAIQALVSVRDKVIAAYEDILRMPI